jgi:hypothetical protein
VLCVIMMLIDQQVLHTHTLSLCLCVFLSKVRGGGKCGKEIVGVFMPHEGKT